MVGVLVYRVFRNESKRSVKILHALLHMMALIISIVGKFCLHLCTHTNKLAFVCLSSTTSLVYFSVHALFHGVKTLNSLVVKVNAV